MSHKIYNDYIAKMKKIISKEFHAEIDKRGKEGAYLIKPDGSINRTMLKIQEYLEETIEAEDLN